MHAVHFWGQGRSYLADQRVSYLWLKERGRERGIWALALGWNMDTQGIFCFACRQTEGAAYSTFHFCSSVPVSHTNLYLSVYLTTIIFNSMSVYLLVYNWSFSSTSNTRTAPNTIGPKYRCLACPCFIIGPMLIFPSPSHSLSVTGRTLSDR